MKRELIFMDAKSSKFWTIEVSGSSHTVSYGRIGSKGQISTKEFPDGDAASKDAEKLVKEKVAKGYVDAASDAAQSEDATAIPLVAFTGISRREDIWRNAGTFVGLRVVDYDAEKPAKSDVAYRFRSDWEGKNAVDEIKHFMATPAALEATALVVGAWQGDDSSVSPDAVVALLVEQKDRLPKLAALYLGDITSEENEMSWINQTDLSPLLAAYPSLQLLRARGGESLSLSKPEHQGLRGLILETGGMDGSVVRSLGVANFPSLEYLELWLGTDEYGGNVTVDDLRPILLGESFPRLKYLGLRNSDTVDQIAAALVDSPIVAKIETLDLSLGTLSDAGGRALLELKSQSLSKLNLHHHYLSAEMVRGLKALSMTVDAANSGDMEGSEEDRYVAVGE